MKKLNLIVEVINRNTLKIDKKLTLRHILIWFSLTLFLSFTDPIDGSMRVVILTTSLVMLSYIIIYYLNSFILMPLFYSDLKLISIILSIVIFLFFLGVHYYIDFVLLYDPNDLIMANGSWMSRKLYVFIIIIFVSSGFYENRKGLFAFQAQINKEKLFINQELGFLKNQFNHHISFNFLNYCYSYVLKSDDSTAKVISIYSDMLRYTLDSKADEAMPLNLEIEYIKQYLELQKQFIPRLAANFDVQGEIHGRNILPRVLISFVENVFKHGITDDAKKPIAISLIVGKNNLIFKVENTKVLLKPIVPSTGIGQFNAKSQLDLFYENKYQLDIIENETKYLCILTLKL